MSVFELPENLLDEINPLDLEPILDHTFAVQIEGIEIQSLIGGFKEVDGLEQYRDTEDITEGGFMGVYKYHRRNRNRDITLRSGFAVGRFLEAWYEYAQNHTKGMPDYHRNVTIIAIGHLRPNVPYEAKSWQLIGAAPIRWKPHTMNSESNQLAIIELVLTYQGIKRTKSIFDSNFAKTIGVFS